MNSAEIMDAVAQLVYREDVQLMVISIFISIFIAIAVAFEIVRRLLPMLDRWTAEQEDKPKRKNDETETEPQPAVSYFELGDDGELIEVFEKPKRTVTGEE